MASTTPYGSISAPQEEHDTSTVFNLSSSSSTVRFGTREALEHRSDLDKQLSNLHKSTELLEIIKVDSNHLLSNVRFTCDLASPTSMTLFSASTTS
ncbi:unnamed protein product [Ilex paraguariensis]|uniref:Uncharacterized protein n=1 Tax=Ilex paraguariensis TaxID=185542 RepID=A0ABC8RUU8_9AQUA